MSPIRALPLSALLFGLLVAALVVLGLGGIERGDELTGGTALRSRQLLWVFISAAASLVALLVPYRLLRGWTLPLYLVCVGMLVVVYFFPARNGARRWIPLGFMDFQPSELAKLAYVLALSEYLMFRENHRTLWGLGIPFVLTLVPVILILREPDLGTSLLFFPALFAMLFAAGARPRHLIVACLLGACCVPILWTVMSAEQKSRITAVFQQQDHGQPQMGDGYHLYQSKQVLALGGLWGSDVSGMPVADPAAYRLPASRTDFIFCLIGERWGLPGTLGVLMIYTGLMFCGLWIAIQTREPFGRLLVVGFTTLFMFQCLINMAMTVGIAPITGVTLPFVSYGGSSLLTTMLAMSLVINAALRPGFAVTGEPFRFRA